MSAQKREVVISEMQEAADRMGLDLEDLQEMILDVLDDCKAKSAKLRNAVQEGDSVALKALAHDIKGSTANYGLKLPSSIALYIEKNCDEDLSDKVDELEATFDSLLTLELDQ